METNEKPRDIGAIILDILRLKEDWKHALRHSDDRVVREHLHAAVNLGHDLDFAVNNSIYALVEKVVLRAYEDDIRAP